MSWTSQFAQLGLVPSDPDWLVWKKIAGQLDKYLGSGTAIAPTSSIPSPTTDNGPGWTASHGVNGIPYTSSDQHSSPSNCTDAPSAGKSLVITDLLISVDTQMSVKLIDSVSSAIVWGPHYLPANSGTVQNTTRSQIKLSVGAKLQVQTSVAGNVTVDAFYYSL